MVSEYEVKHGLPSVKEVADLLNTAYGEWGDEEMFEWKYSCPGTARYNHHLYIWEVEDLMILFELAGKPK